jgi:hypothetical protein
MSDTIERIPIATTVTFGRRHSGAEAASTDDFWIRIQGYNEVALPDGTIVRTSMKDVECAMSQIIADPAVQAAFPAIYDVVVRLMRGQLVPATPAQAPDEVLP